MDNTELIKKAKAYLTTLRLAEGGLSEVAKDNCIDCLDTVTTALEQAEAELTTLREGKGKVLITQDKVCLTRELNRLKAECEGKVLVNAEALEKLIECVDLTRMCEGCPCDKGSCEYGVIAGATCQGSIKKELGIDE